jgi:hypothetical protein
MFASYIGFVAEILVAILLIATSWSCYTLGQKISVFKADETAMRTVIRELVDASETAERAIIGLRAALSESQRHLSNKLEEADRINTQLSAQILKINGLIEQTETVASDVRDVVHQGHITRGVLEQTLQTLTSPTTELTLDKPLTPPSMAHNPDSVTPLHARVDAEPMLRAFSDDRLSPPASKAIAPQRAVHSVLDARAIQQVLETSLKPHVVSQQVVVSTPEAVSTPSDVRLTKAAAIAQGLVERAMKRLDAQAA